MVQWWHSKIIIYNYAVVVFVDISPHLCVGFLFLVLYPAVRLPSFSRPLVITHHLLTHNLSTHNLSTHNLSTHHLSSHNLSSHHLSSHKLSSHHLLTHHTITTTCQLVHTQLVITPLVITQLVITPLVITPLVIPPLVITPLVITQLVITPLAHTSHHDNNLSSHHLTTWIVTLGGRRGTWWHGLFTQLVITPLVIPPLVITPLVITQLVITPLVITPLAHTSHHHNNLSSLGDSTLWHGPSLCVAGVALCDIHLHFVWQAWHFVTSTFTLCGRRGTWRHGSSLCVAGVALMALGWFWWRAWSAGGAVTPRLFAWQAWHFVTSTFTLCGRRGTWRHRLLLCVAGVALMALGWPWWRAWSAGGAVTPWRFAWQAWHFETSTFVSRGRRGTWTHRLPCHDKHLLPGNDFIAQIQHSRASSSLIVLLRYVCWKRLMPGTAFIGRPNTLVRRDLWSYC